MPRTPEGGVPIPALDQAPSLDQVKSEFLQGKRSLNEVAKRLLQTMAGDKTTFLAVQYYTLSQDHIGRGIEIMYTGAEGQDAVSPTAQERDGFGNPTSAIFDDVRKFLHGQEAAHIFLGKDRKFNRRITRSSRRGDNFSSERQKNQNIDFQEVRKDPLIKRLMDYSTSELDSADLNTEETRRKALAELEAFTKQLWEATYSV